MLIYIGTVIHLLNKAKDDVHVQVSFLGTGGEGRISSKRGFVAEIITAIQNQAHTSPLSLNGISFRLPVSVCLNSVFCITTLYPRYFLRNRPRYIYIELFNFYPKWATSLLMWRQTQLQVLQRCRGTHLNFITCHLEYFYYQYYFSGTIGLACFPCFIWKGRFIRRGRFMGL